MFYGQTSNIGVLCGCDISTTTATTVIELWTIVNKKGESKNILYHVWFMYRRDYIRFYLRVKNISLLKNVLLINTVHT